MLQWALYTMVFGFAIGANNMAHAAGFVSGAALGLVVQPRYRRRTAPGPLTTASAIVSLLVVVISAAVALAPETVGAWLPLLPLP